MHDITPCQRLLAAPVALGCIGTPMATASELTLAGIRSDAGDQRFSSVNRFSDLRPGDWAYQALSNLNERYGCVAGYPDGTFNGGRVITRYEAAAVLSACLDRISEITDALKRLMQEFDQELTALRGRVDGLEARVGALEATRFSTTTTLEGQASFVIGANSFPGEGSDRAAAAFGATTFNVDLQLALNTSFSGKDLLVALLRAGNFAASSFGGAGPSSLSTLEVAFQEDSGADVVGIDRLYYSVPIGKRLKATIGGRVGQEDMLPIWPTAYGSDRGATVLDVMTLPGAASGAFNKTLGAGGALAWTSGGFAIGASYVSANGWIGGPRDGGIATDGALASGTVQIGFQAKQWAVAATYSHLTGSSLIPYGTAFLQDRLVADGSADSEAYALSAYWQPARSGWIPSISVGWGINHHRYPASIPYGAVTTSQSWLVGLEWDGVVVDGHAFGMAVGQPTFATDRSAGGSPRDGNVAWEWWTKLQLSDRIAVTPALFYLSRPLGQLTPRGERFSQFGALVRTTFTF